MKIITADSGEKNKQEENARQDHLGKKQLYLVHHYYSAERYVDAAEQEEIGYFFYQNRRKN